jgi:hypothetical protein
MTPKVLILISCDPRVSHRPAEAIRIAAGVGVWKKTDVTVYLRGPAVLLLRDEPGALVDEDVVRQYLPLVTEGGRPIHVEQGAPELKQIGKTPLLIRPTSDEQLSQLAAQSTYLVHF